MIPEGSEERGDQMPPQQLYRIPARREPSFGKYIFYLTWGVTFLFLIMSIALTINPVWASQLSSTFPPYFFILLLPISFPEAQVLIILILMFALYLVFFLYMMYSSAKSKEKYVLDTPAGYYVAASSAVFLLVTIITIIESMFNAPVGGGGLENGFQTQPFLTYFQVIYAPFAEEVGFRIIPLGLLTFYMIYKYSHNFRDSLISFFVPGRIRKKYGMTFTKYDWALIIITSAIFGYAHIFFGAWDWGKFIPTFITGIILAIGFLKFGLYVDIPMHWFFNGFLTLYVVEPSLIYASGLTALWIYFVGVVAVVFILLYIRNYYLSKSETFGPV